MDSKNSILNKIYSKLLWVGVGLLSLIALIILFGPFTQASGTAINIIAAIALPGVFVLGLYARKSLRIEDLLIVFGAILAAIVLVSMIGTWTQYGLFHALIHSKIPTYYLDAVPYDVTKEVMFLDGFKMKTVTTEYAGIFSVLCGAFLPGAFFIDRKKMKPEFIFILVIGSVGLLSLLTVPNFKGLIILAIVSLFAVLYKFYWENKKVITTVRFTLIGLFVFFALFYVVAGFNALAGFKFSGFLEKIFVANPIMRNASDVLEGMNIKDGSKLVNLFGLNPNALIRSDFEFYSLTKSGIFEVELLKEVGVFGITLFMLFVSVSFASFDRQLSHGQNSDFERVTLVMLFASFFVYESLFYDQMPMIYEVDMAYKPFLRFIPFLVLLFFLGMSYYREDFKLEAKK
mgnify:CR=1 FL=1